MWNDIFGGSVPAISSDINILGLLSSKNRNCTDGVQWMWVAFSQCAVTPKEIIAVVMGLISIMAWIFNGTPQIVENCKLGLPDQALSPFLLAFWTFGDLLSLTGGILTSQLFLQIAMAAYSIFNDGILISQFFYYRSRHKKMLSELSESEVTPLLVTSTEGTVSASVSTLLCMACFLFLSGNFLQLPYSSSSIQMGSRRLLTTSFKSQSLSPTISPIHLPFFPNSAAYAGYVLGWCSSLMYLSSRIPQIFKNWQRRSTKGLSIYLFMFALIGNMTYGLQIFLTSNESIFLLRALPWILGSIGVLILDLMIFCQFYFYRNQCYFGPVQSC